MIIHGDYELQGGYCDPERGESTQQEEEEEGVGMPLPMLPPPLLLHNVMFRHNHRHRHRHRHRPYCHCHHCRFIYWKSTMPSFSVFRHHRPFALSSYFAASISVGRNHIPPSSLHWRIMFAVYAFTFVLNTYSTIISFAHALSS